MRNSVLIIFIAIVSFLPTNAAKIVSIKLEPDDASPLIPKEIYGQFAEHLGACVYGGLWVGKDSEIPNIEGYRRDVVEALKDLHIPVLRWPGGCFADEYHWMNGIGPEDKRLGIINSNWGGTIEDNSFGTNEFFNLCELLGCEPYLSGNVGSGTVEELARWVEYITASAGPMADMRKANGRENPWRLKYLGVGNESWGCGGNFTPEYYSDVYRRYQTYCRNYDGNHLFKIASGASDYDYNWTEVLMKNAGKLMDGLSLHYYTVLDWNDKGSATNFSHQDYYKTVSKCLEIDEVINKHCDIMDKYDPEKRVGLLVDEWGTWYEVEPGTNPGHLFQQNTMRDAIVAALTFNIFNRHSSRVRMANIAQIANVLQSMVLTQGSEMVVTPTYYVFKMYVPHQGARLVPIKVDSPDLESENGAKIPVVSACASCKDGCTTISLVNTGLDEEAVVTIELPAKGVGSVEGEILHASSIKDYNAFGMPERVRLSPLSAKQWALKNSTLTVKLPAASVVTIKVKA